MVALKGKSVAQFLQASMPAQAVMLFYGPDEGLVRERANDMAKKLVTDFSDAFNYIELTDADIKATPSRLQDEAVAQSLMGGERVVRLRSGGEGSATAIKNFLQALDGGEVIPNGLVIIEAGDLTPRSAIRKAFETSKQAVAIPGYADNQRDLSGVVRDALRAENIDAEPEVIELISNALGDDRGITRSELEKLVLYVGPKELRDEPATLHIEDVRACLVDGLGDSLNDVVSACADGRTLALSTALYRAEVSGASPIGILRALQRQFSRLNSARALIEKGESVQGAMKKLRPPVFFAEAPAFERRLKKWYGARLQAAQKC